MPAFPEPTGPYAVGCSDLVSKCGPDRCLFRIFYPAAETTEAKNALWMPSREYFDGFANVVKFKSFAWLLRYLFSEAHMHATLNADLNRTTRTGKMPVVLFSHGLSASRTTYSHVCIELASKGALVASLEHADETATATYYLQQDESNKNMYKKVWIPYTNVPNNHSKEHEIRNKQLHKRAGECIAALDHLTELNNGTFCGVSTEIDLAQFQDQLDLKKVAILGHSFGGATTIATLSKDSRFRVGIALDSWMYPLEKNIYKNLPPVPFLFVNAYNCQWPGNLAGMRKLDADIFNTNAERKLVTILDSNHFSQTDFSLLLNWNWFTRISKLHGSVDPAFLMKVNHDLVGAFIGKHLELGFGAELNDIVKQHKQHVMFGSNVAVDEEKVMKAKRELRTSMQS